MLNNWFKKEKPFAGFAGFGGGATGLTFGGGGPFSATGGIKYWNSSENGGTMYHIFKDSADFVCTGSGEVEVLIVAGGGSGANGQAGGGGGGGVVHGATVSVSGIIPVVVGDGGAAVAGGAYNLCGNRGGPSSFKGVTAIGGGGGAKNNYAWGGLSTPEQNQVSGANGGGGGGGTLSGSGSNFPTAVIVPQPVPGSYVAYGGHYGAPVSTTSNGSGGGGGGAGGNSPGPAAPRGANVRSPGGPGKAIPSFNSTNLAWMPGTWTAAVGPTGLYGGGGGGGEDGSNGSGYGGPGGGGPGQNPAEYPSPGAVANTGGGGGDRGAPGLPEQYTAGAKGIVMVKYASETAVGDETASMGGEEFTVGSYKYHVFTAGAGEFVVGSALTCDILMVAGGGGGGTDRNAGAAGGGGGGGLIYVENHPLAAANWKIWVGNGGVAQPDASARSNPGQNTILTAESTIPSSDRTKTSDTWGYPATTLIALGGGGGACTNNNNNENGFGGGTGGGGGSSSGSGGAGVQTNQPSLPAVSKSSGNGTNGRNSGSYPARGGGGGGHSNSYGQGNQYQGGHDGYQVPASFLPTSVPADFANLLGANHPTPKGGGIATNSPEWRYFAGGGGGSDNVPATDNSHQGSGGLGGGGNAGGDGRPSPSNPRTARTGTTYHGIGNETSPGVNGRGGGGAANGLDDAGNSYEYYGGTGGNGIIIIRVPNS